MADSLQKKEIGKYLIMNIKYCSLVSPMGDAYLINIHNFPLPASIGEGVGCWILSRIRKFAGRRSLVTSSPPALCVSSTLLSWMGQDWKEKKKNRPASRF